MLWAAGAPPAGVDTELTLGKALEARGAPATRGDPQSPLRGTGQRTRTVAEEWQGKGPAVGSRTGAALLQTLGSSRHAPRKTREGGRRTLIVRRSASLALARCGRFNGGDSPSSR